MVRKKVFGLNTGKMDSCGIKVDYKNGKKEGSWVSYYNDGSIWKQFSGTFKNGKKISD